ncbi:MAG: protein kinase [Candidatus Solibacter sp.]
METIGRYKIVRELGRGAMGVVYHAIDPNIGRPVAIKTIRFGDKKPEELERMRERLFREARSAGMLSHPGIVTIYDVEQQGDLAYIAMEFVDGPTLDQVLNDGEPLAADSMFSVLGQTAVALDYAHSKGIVHRDIKPANIMLSDDGTAKIADFGIAKITDAENLTMTGSIVGTPHYMSPEQVQGLPVDGRSDQFSLAVIAYEMLTGEKPYTGEHLTTVVYKIVAEEPVPPHRLNPTLAGPIEQVLKKVMAKKPEARYPNCQEFAEALERACSTTKGWRLMPRGGLLNAPTMADVKSPLALPTRNAPASAPPKIVSLPSPAPASVAAPTAAATLPPPRHKSREAATTTATREIKKKSGFPMFLVAVLIAAGLLAVIGWKFAPWLMPGRDVAETPADRKESPPVAALTPAPVPVTPQSVPQPANPADAKPSPVGPATQSAAQSPQPAVPVVTEGAPAKPAPEGEPRIKAVPEPAVRASAAQAQEVTLLSSPSGAMATVDGNRALSCTTPCSLMLAQGRHSVAVALAGTQLERRDFTVGASPLELAPIPMRPAGGTLMLTSVPPGASITVNGRKFEQVTPAQIALPVGAYSIVVEKGGLQATEKVEISSGIVTRKIILGQ